MASQATSGFNPSMSQFSTAGSALSGEAGLASAIASQSSVFAEAMKTIEKIQSDVDLRDPASEPGIQQLQSALEQITAAQLLVADAHQKVRQSGKPLSIGLKDELFRHEETLRDLLTRINEVQKQFETARRDLIPQLDGESRRRSMHSAYKQSLRTI